MCVGRGGGGATHMVLGALIDGLNIALHLQDLGHSRTSVRTTETGFGGRHGAAWFLPSWSPALRAQEWEFSLRGALWATSPPPAEAVVDKVSRTPSEGRSRSWDVGTKEARRQDNRGVPVVLRRRVFPYLTSSKNLSSSRAGNCESLEEAEKTVNGREKVAPCGSAAKLNATGLNSLHLHAIPGLNDHQVGVHVLGDFLQRVLWDHICQETHDTPTIS